MTLEQFTTPGGNIARLHIRPDTNDHNTAWSCLNENEYQLGPVTGTAWDIGAHIGSVTVGLALDNPDLRVVAVEPVPENVAALRANLTLNGVQDRVTVIAGAVGHGEVSVSYAYAGSEIATHHAFIGNAILLDEPGTKTATYPGLAIADLLFEYGFPALVKIDTEGAEWGFLNDGYVVDLPLIVGEWHQIGGTQNQFSDLLWTHDVTFSGPMTGPGGFRAVLS